MEYEPKLNEKYTPVLQSINFEGTSFKRIKKIKLPVLLFLVLHELLHQQISFFTNF